MAGLYVREQWIWNKMANQKFAGREANIMGQPLFVLPTTAYASYSAIAFARNHNKNVYDTLNLAYAAAVSGRGDAIVLIPGTHTPSASIATSKAGVSIIGPEAWMGMSVRRPSATIVGPAADEAFNITGANMGFYGLTCVPITAKSFADFTGAANGLTVKGCYLDLAVPVVNIATAGFTGSAAIEDFLFEGNIAWSDGAQGPALTLTGANLNGKLKGNHYHVDAGSWAVAVSLAAIDGLVVEGDLATCGGTAMTACYNGSGTTVVAGVVFRDCRNGVLVTKLVDGFGTNSHAELARNWIAEVGAGAGGATLVTVVT